MICCPAGIRADWPWWDDLHAFWRELPNYNPHGVQSSDPGFQHALDAGNLFATAPVDEDPDDADARGGSDEEDDRDASLVGHSYHHAAVYIVNVTAESNRIWPTCGQLVTISESSTIHTSCARLVPVSPATHTT